MRISMAQRMFLKKTHITFTYRCDVLVWYGRMTFLKKQSWIKNFKVWVRWYFYNKTSCPIGAWGPCRRSAVVRRLAIPVMSGEQDGVAIDWWWVRPRYPRLRCTALQLQPRCSGPPSIAFKTLDKKEIFATSCKKIRCDKLYFSIYLRYVYMTCIWFLYIFITNQESTPTN